MQCSSPSAITRLRRARSLERGMSGTAMAGLPARTLWPKASGRPSCGGSCPRSGRRPATFPRRGRIVPVREADLIRAHLANALHDPAQLVTTAGTVAVTVSASLLMTPSAPRTHERPERVPIPAPALEPAPPHPVVLRPQRRHQPPRPLVGPGRAGQPTRAQPRSFQRSRSSGPSTERCLATAWRGLRLGWPAAQACGQRAPQGVEQQLCSRGSPAG